MPSSFGLTVVTGGLNPDVYNSQTSLITGGLSPVLVPQPGPLDSSPGIIAAQNGPISTGLGITTAGSGTIIVGSTGVTVGTAGTLAISAFDSLVSNIALPPGATLFNPSGGLTQDLVNNTTTYTGSDLHIIVDLVNAVTTSGQASNLKQLIECTTFTVSVHREKAAVRAAGYINPKGFARGRRTIAGTIVLTQFTVDVLYEFLMGQQILGHDVSKDTNYVKVDQLPPFNMTLLFTDEYGNVSYRRVLGVDFVTDGVVYSSNDMLSEQTISYMASDFTPLINIQDNAQFRPQTPSSASSTQKTVGNVLTGGSVFAIPPTNIFSRA